jgi:hypothetical protein
MLANIMLPAVLQQAYFSDMGIERKAQIQTEGEHEQGIEKERWLEREHDGERERERETERVVHETVGMG